MANWLVDSKTGDYQMLAGNPVQDDSLVTVAYLLLKTPRTKWMYAPDVTYGSDYYSLHIRVKDYSALIEAGQRALQPLLDSGRAKSVSVDLTNSARGGAELKISIVDNSGNPQVFNFTPVGGI